MRRAYISGKSSCGGFVDLSYPGHPIMEEDFDDSALPLSYYSEMNVNNNECETSSRGAYPHVLGYYEVDIRKVFPRDEKKGSSSVDYLRNALFRVATSVSRYCLKPSWVQFRNHMDAVREKAGSLVFMSLEDCLAIARNFDMTNAETVSALAFLHRKGQLVYFGGGEEDVLGKVVVVNAEWFAGMVAAMLGRFVESVVRVLDVVGSVGGRELDRQLQKVMINNIYY